VVWSFTTKNETSKRIGQFDIWIGGDSNAELKALFRIEGL